MERKKTIFDYAAQVLLVFGITVTFVSICSFIAGEAGPEISTLFALGTRGLSFATMAQIMALSVLVTAARFVFFSDCIFKALSVVARTAGMLISCIAFIVAFVLIFGWFPKGEIWPWLCFAASFIICFAVSYLLTKKREQLENKQMAEALKRLKGDD